jgi:hypothetical protein
MTALRFPPARFAVQSSRDSRGVDLERQARHGHSPGSACRPRKSDRGPGTVQRCFQPRRQVRHSVRGKGGESIGRDAKRPGHVGIGHCNSQRLQSLNQCAHRGGDRWHR